MKIKYRNKVYDSDNVPIFLYFKEGIQRKDFADQLVNYSKLGEYVKFTSIHSALAGSVIINDRRAAIYVSIDRIEEKQILQKSLFEVLEDDSNAMLCSPVDISETVLHEWIEKNLDALK